MKNVILSTTIRFTTASDVLAYSGLTNEARPRLDVEFTEATKIVVGFQHIVLFGATGRRMAVLSRKDYVGMAIDGKPVVVAGDEFKPFTVDEADEKSDAIPVDGAEENEAQNALNEMFGNPIEALNNLAVRDDDSCAECDLTQYTEN